MWAVTMVLLDAVVTVTAVATVGDGGWPPEPTWLPHAVRSTTAVTRYLHRECITGDGAPTSIAVSLSRPQPFLGARPRSRTGPRPGAAPSASRRRHRLVRPVLHDE